MKLRDLMEAAYKFLQQEQSVFRELWDWSVCVPLLRSHDTLVRWCVAVGLFLCLQCGHDRGSRVECMSREVKLFKMCCFCSYSFSLIMCDFRGNRDDMNGVPLFACSVE